MTLAKKKEHPIKSVRFLAVKKEKLRFALGFANIGVFLIVVAYLPKKTSFSYSGAISEVINSRDRWDIPFLVLLGTLALSAAISILFSHEEKG